MQVESLKNVSDHLKKQYLRVARIAVDNNLSYFYIGSDKASQVYLSSLFSSGFTAANFETAKKMLNSDGFANEKVDVIIIDIPYKEKEIVQFHSFLKGIGNIKLSTPVIYNESQVKAVKEINHDVVDDVIDLSNFEFDLSGKLSFLQRSKENSGSRAKRLPKIKPATCLYKRILDIILASILILISLPVFILISLAIIIESKGPVFYNAKRAGKGFRIFKFYKFRTMIMNADMKVDALAHLNQYRDQPHGPLFFKVSNDPRVTRIGRFLRNSSLDELPQLFNVLKGDMSLVGNRPLPLYEAATLTTNEYVERFMAPAGITGLWQIKKRGKAEMSVNERISLDISYARKFTLLYDLWIMANTPGALLQKTDV